MVGIQRSDQFRSSCSQRDSRPPEDRMFRVRSMLRWMGCWRELPMRGWRSGQSRRSGTSCTRETQKSQERSRCPSDARTDAAHVRWRIGVPPVKAAAAAAAAAERPIGSSLQIRWTVHFHALFFAHFSPRSCAFGCFRTQPCRRSNKPDFARPPPHGCPASAGGGGGHSQSAPYVKQCSRLGYLPATT